MSHYEDCVIFLLAKAHQAAHWTFRRRLMAYDLTPIQHLVLEALWEEDGITAGEIGRRLTLDSATLTGLLDRMSANGWITKKKDSQDRRYLRAYLTPRAKSMRETLMAERDQCNNQVLQGFSSEERERFKSLLRKVQGALSQETE